ncbi:AMP-binding protein [Aureimonas sp. AU20]|uniref:AMP-binding protein n=1 Tax=Aureimonas sp. AU20 TaxID=1349819 RepID=UPI0009EBA4E5|nr:AMP-binding protein [Aureimonas sp. AU20]
MDRLAGNIPPRSIAVTAVIAKSSVDFVEAAFELYEKRRPFLIVSASGVSEKRPGLELVDVIEPDDRTGWVSGLRRFPGGSDIAQVTFTSGTTGMPKGICLTYEALNDTVERLNTVMSLDGSVREYVGVPPNYSFGLGRFRACAAVGGQAFIPPRGFDVGEIAAMLRREEINALSAVPTLLRILLKNADAIGSSGRNMRWIEIGSQYMSRSEKEALKALFPNARIVQHYGLTEASRTTFLDLTATDGEGLESVGRPVGQTRVEIAEDGRIRICGPHVAKFAMADGAFSPLTDADGWLTTNDLGEMRDGNLFYQGRADDLINCGGIKISPELIEAELREALTPSPAVSLARIPDPLRGDGMLLAHLPGPHDEAALRAATEAVLRKRGLVVGNALKLTQVERFPVTATGKVQRRILGENFVREETDRSLHDQIDRAIAPQDADTIRALFEAEFNRPCIRDEDSFVSLGGDSLTFVVISAAIEDRFGSLPKGWEVLPLANLEALFPKPREQSGGVLAMRSISMETAMRAIATLMVVAHHTFKAEVGAGVDILIMLAGLSMARVQRARLVSSKRWTILRDVFLKIVLPYYLVLVAFSLRRMDGSVAEFLLVSNFVGRVGSLLTPFWFIEAYIQSILVLILFACIPAVRTFIRDQPAKFGFAFLAAAIGIKIIAILTFDHDELLNRTPDQFIYLFAIGWCIYFANTWTRTALVVGIAAFAAFLNYASVPWWGGFGGEMRGAYKLAAVMLLVAVPVLVMPDLVRRLFLEISFASFAIYISHSLTIPRLREVMPPTILTIVLVAIGIAISHTIKLALPIAKTYANRRVQQR